MTPSMSRPRLLVLCFAALLLLWGCSTTTFTSTWKAPGAEGIRPVGKTIAALVISSDANSRKSAEVYLANNLTIRGARGIPAYTLLGTDHGDGDYARTRRKRRESMASWSCAQWGRING